MNKEPIKVLSKSRFYLVIAFIPLLLLIDMIVGLKVVVKLPTVWYESTIGIIFFIMLTILMIGFINSFLSKVYLFDDHLFIKTMFKKKKIYYKEITELSFNSTGSPQNFYFALYGSNNNVLGIINLQYLGKLHKQKDFIQFIMKQQPTVKLDKNCERLLNR